MTTKPEPRLLQYYSLSGAAERAEVTEGAIRVAIRSGHLIEYRSLDGRAPMVRARELERWIEKRKSPAS